MKRNPFTLIVLSLVCLLLFAITVIAAPAREQPQVVTTITATDTFPGTPTPLLMLTEFDPWNMVLGSDSPSFVLYDTGLVIVLSENASGEFEYVSVQLSPAERNELFESLAGDWEQRQTFFELESYYDLTLATDQPTSTIYLFDTFGGGHSVSVYGELHGNDSIAGSESAPEAFLRLYDAISAYDAKFARPWLPDYFEVIVWEYDYSDPVDWPSDFPDLDDPATVERDSVYSLYIPIEDLSRFQSLVDDAVAIRMNGQTWAFSVRYPLPHEYNIP
jgi:hypothetical protein